MDQQAQFNFVFPTLGARLWVNDFQLGVENFLSGFFSAPAKCWYRLYGNWRVKRPLHFFKLMHAYAIS